MITPADLELPGKFGSWRPGQFETIVKIAASTNFAYLLDAPTGSGKSLIAAGVQRVLGKNITYLTTTKQLQDQLLKDFPYAKTLKGRTNYPCLNHSNMFPDISADDCTHTDEKQCDRRSECPYTLAKRAALSAPIAVLNTAYFLSEANYVGSFSGAGLLVVDEFDTMEDQLMSFVKVVITARQLANLKVQPPQFKTKFESWITWGRSTLIELRPKLRQLERDTEESTWKTEDVRALREKRMLKRLIGKLEFFVREVDNTWVWYPQESMWTFQPVWVAKYANNVLWQHAKKVLGMSATILDAKQVSSNIGLLSQERQYTYKTLPSPFPKENRPVYFQPCANVVAKQMDFALVRLTKAITAIIDKHPDDKILIHTVSYKVKSHLMSNIKNDRLITHGIKDRATVLSKFKESPRPLVLLSPSMDRGVDLPKDECRVVVIAKIPYADLGDNQVSRRVFGSKDGNKWYAHKTISTIVQMAGRGVRSADDYAITYILDEQFRKLYTQNRAMFPAWFREAVVM